MRSSLVYITFVVFFVCGAALVGCGDDDVTPDAGTADTGGGPDTSSDASAMTWDDTMLRVTEVTITQPSGVGSVLAGIINAEVRANNIHILIELSDFAATSGATTFQLHGDAGELDDVSGEYSFTGTSDAVSATMTADGTFSNDVDAGVDFPIRFTVIPECDGGDCPNDECRDNNDCPVNFTCDSEGDGTCFEMVILPLHEVDLNGQLTIVSDAFAITAATMEGQVLKSDADDMQINLGGTTRILTDILGEENMDCPPGASTLTGWCLTAILNAEQVNND